MIDDYITLQINKYNHKYFLNKGYDANLKDHISVKSKDINKGSHLKIDAKCDICGLIKSMEFRTYHKLSNGLIEKYYCKKCSYIKNKETNLEKYGVDHPMKNIEIKKKTNETNLEKYGVVRSSMINEFENKKIKTNLKRYGVKHIMQLTETKNKYKKTNLEKYGVEHPNKNNNIKNKIKKTKLEKYNDSTFNNKPKTIKTNLEKYGYNNPMQNINIINKVIATKSLNLIKKYPNILSVDYNNKQLEMICDCKKNHTFKTSMSIFQNRKAINTKQCLICNPNNGTTSGKEIFFYDFIKENYDKEIITNDRKILNGKELDIYLPDLKLAFEFNGVYWHNELNKPNNYHKNKSDLCEKIGINLIHIYEDDWIYKQDVIKSMILNKLGKSLNKIYARKTEVKEVVDNKLVREFLNKNHIQGFVGSKVKIGLFFQNELVSLMTFGKLRKAMNSTSSEGQFEMLRYCNKLNTNIIGGASKLFKYFIKNYDFEEIITYADKSHSNGKLYEILGFKYIHTSKPNYYYVIDNIRHHRFNFRKDILIKEGYDANKTEHQIMLERKIYRIYNSGNLKFKYLKIPEQ